MIHRFRAAAMVVGVMAGLIGAGSAAAQPCGSQWLPGEGIPGTDGTVSATAMWDPDGVGPKGSCLVVGGSFKLAGKAVASNIALYDESTGEWSALGSGIAGGETPNVSALAVLPNGDLVAGGVFSTAGGAPAQNIARWDGSAWSSVGSGISGVVADLAVLPSGDVVAGGNFATAGGVAANNIARWDGSAWSPLGDGTSGPVNAVAVTPNGDVVAGGNFATAGDVTVNSIARWDGSAWSPMGPGTTGFVYALAVMPNGDVIAGGYINRMGETFVGHVGRWDGSTWSAFGQGLGSFDDLVSGLAVTSSGEIFAAARFVIPGSSGVIGYTARWDGSAWTRVGSTDSSAMLAVTVLPNGDVAVGGRFSAIRTITGQELIAPNIARWNGLAWSTVGSGTDGLVSALAVLPSGDLVAGGRFTTIGGTSAKYIASWDGSAWSPLGSGLVTPVQALAVLPNGDVVAGGDIYRDLVVRWDGSSWTSLGAGVGGWVYALVVMPNGDLIAGGQFTSAGGVPVAHIARWNGSSWSALGSGIGGGTPPSVRSLAVLPNGDLVAGGTFTIAGGVSVFNIAKWNGSAWSAVGTGLSGDSPVISALTVLPNGDLIAGGRFITSILTSVNHIARWNGSAWSALGSGMNERVNALALLPGGDLVASGRFTTAGGTPAASIARWNGSAWSALGAESTGGAAALAVLPTGELVSSSGFVGADGRVSAYFSRYSFTGIPTISVQPEPRTAFEGETLILSATPSSGYSNVSVRWLRDGVPIVDGSGGASAGGGMVSGAMELLPSPTDGTPAELAIVDAQLSDAGSYSAVFSNDCGEVASGAAEVIVRSVCAADLDSDGVVDFVDYLEFLSLFDAGDLRVDFTGDGVIDFGDHLEFLNHFEAGC